MRGGAGVPEWEESRRAQEGAAGGSERGVPEEPASALGLRACLPGEGSWRTNLLARGGVGADGPGQWAFPVLCN